jgi:hypothetical protein
MTAANAAPCAMEALRRKIGQRAYALWECEGKPCGSDLEHLCQAESEVMAGCCTASDATAPAETAIRSVRTAVRATSTNGSRHCPRSQALPCATFQLPLWLSTS